ncbi:MAG: amidase [Polyangiaceae bacterium]
MIGTSRSGFCEHARRPRRFGNAHGPLHGLDFAVKDVFALAGERACFGNPLWLESHPPAERTARVTSLLLEAGANLIGLTKTDELALSLTGENAHYGTPENPRAPECVPGGSSSGSASVVALGQADFALGTDTGGSVRVPASHTGLFGFRPSHGLISSEGVLPLAPRFDTVGVFAREGSVLDRVCGVLLPDLELPEPERLIALRDLKIFLDPDAIAVFEHSAAALADDLGLPLEWRSISPSVPAPSEWLATYLKLQNLEAASIHRSWLEQKRPQFGSLIARRIQWLLSTDASAAASAEAQREAITEWLSALLGARAWLILPSAPGAPPLRGLSDEATEQYTGRALSLNSLASLSGLPQLSLPLATVRGYPFGISLLGPRRADRALLRAAQRSQLGVTP